MIRPHENSQERAPAGRRHSPAKATERASLYRPAFSFPKNGADPRASVTARVLFPTVALLAGLFLAACDFHGPWDFYPEKRDVYTGIYTYAYVPLDGAPYACFSKVYELEEASAEDFAFYDSARVTVQGKFQKDGENYDTTLTLRPTDDPNCFSTNLFTFLPNLVGIQGESYLLDAYFVWDSAGTTVASTYRATATIPEPVKITGLNVPQQDGSYKWKDYQASSSGLIDPVQITFLEFPMDMMFVKCALEFDNSVGGVLAIMNYNMYNEESQNTTLNHMLEGVTEVDSMGYRGITMHDPLEIRQSLGFTENRTIAGMNNLDTLYLTNMMLPIGQIIVNLYTTDRAYVDYERKVKESVSDSRVVPESNIENGMGVFFGMSKTRLALDVSGSGVPLDYIALQECDKEEGENSDSWDSRACRLYQDVACAGNTLLKNPDLIEANASAYEYYRNPSYGELNKGAKTCYASHVKAAMMLDTTRWSLFLPDTIRAKDKENAYADGLKRYCVASDFKSNTIADCTEMHELCINSLEKNYCKEYLWQWCADREWNMVDYRQCRSAFVSRYYLEELQSSTLEKVVRSICEEEDLPACKGKS